MSARYIDLNRQQKQCFEKQWWLSLIQICVYNTVIQIAMSDNVKVLVRVRPLLKFQHQPAWMVKSNSLISIQNGNKLSRMSSAEKVTTRRESKDTEHQFNFQNVVAQTTTSEQIYKKQIKPTLLDCFNSSRNLSIMAYGQTCSGKTHTILGVKEAPGIIPCTLRELFLLKQSKKCSLKMSYLQIYNEKISDLLERKDGKILKIVEDSKWGCDVTGSIKEVVSSFQEAINILDRGEKQRQYGQGEHHDRSSRSHTLLKIFIEERDSNFTSKSFSITIVDLAGSERLHASMQSATQTGFINKSLFQLAHVISKLADKTSNHIPFRDSKLTRLLQYSLSGLGCSLLICCVSPSTDCYTETLSTLRLAERARKIVLKEEQFESKEQEIDKLKELLKNKTKQCAELKRELIKTNQRIKSLEQQLISSKNNSKMKADLLILLDHENFTAFLGDKLQDFDFSISDLQSIKQNFLSSMQQLYEGYTQSILRHCKGDQFELQIQEVCFMNMVLEHDKINNYRLDIIDELLRQKEDKDAEDNGKFYQALEKYKWKLNRDTNVLRNIPMQYKDYINSERHSQIASLQNLSAHKYSIHESPSLQLDQTKEIEEYGTEILVWGCKKDFRVCKGTVSPLNMIKINNLGQIKQICCGYHHTLVLARDGKVYGWGKNTERQINSTFKESISYPTQIQGLLKIKEVAAGWGHSAALTSDGELYCWGYGKDGQLGTGQTQNQSKPTNVTHIHNIISIFCGHSHTGFIDNTGDFYAFGFNQDYRLMIGDQKIVLSPKRIPIRDVVQASLGVSHSALITSNGSVYCGGTGTHGELGITLNQYVTGWEKIEAVDRKFQEEPYQKVCPLLQVEGFNSKRKAVQVSCGENTTIILDQRGQVFTFGKTTGGRIGHKKLTSSKILQAVDYVQSGSRHSLALKKAENKLYSWGFNMYGQANPSITGDIDQPEILQLDPNQQILSISCGFFHSALLLK